MFKKNKRGEHWLLEGHSISFRKIKVMNEGRHLHFANISLKSPQSSGKCVGPDISNKTK